MSQSPLPGFYLGPSLSLVRVDAAWQPVYANLCQSYEGEFSGITGKLPAADGVFPPDTLLGGAITGWLFFETGSNADFDDPGCGLRSPGEPGSVCRHPIGFAAIRHEAGSGTATLPTYEMCEFYVIPSRRRHGVGKDFAHALFAAHAGFWEVKQLPGAAYATLFWRKVIGAFTAGRFEEDELDDPYWGRVVRQRFVVAATGVRTFQV